MTAFVVVIRRATLDAAEIAAYLSKARAASIGHPLTIRVFQGRHKVLEGPEIESIVILEFPSFEDAEHWYDTPAYREALSHRLRGGDYSAVIVDGDIPEQH